LIFRTNSKEKWIVLALSNWSQWWRGLLLGWWWVNDLNELVKLLDLVSCHWELRGYSDILQFVNLVIEPIRIFLSIFSLNRIHDDNFLCEFELSKFGSPSKELITVHMLALHKVPRKKSVPLLILESLQYFVALSRI